MNLTCYQGDGGISEALWYCNNNWNLVIFAAELQYVSIGDHTVVKTEYMLQIKNNEVYNNADIVDDEQSQAEWPSASGSQHKPLVPAVIGYLH